MPRRRLFTSPRFPYHVTARVNNREPFPADMPIVWKTLTDELHLQSVLGGFRVHAFVLMPNHFHLLVSTPGDPIHRCMQGFLSSSARIIHTRAGRSGHLFGERYHWSLIRDPLYYAHALKYIYRNPVKASLCAHVESYPFSTLTGLIGAVPLPLPVHPAPEYLDRLLPRPYDQLLIWLNRPHKSEEQAILQKALRRRIFKLPVKRNNRKAFILSGISPSGHTEPG